MLPCLLQVREAVRGLKSGGGGGVGGQTALGGVTGSLIGGLEILLDLDLILMAIKGFGTRNGETRHDMIKTVF